MQVNNFGSVGHVGLLCMCFKDSEAITITRSDNLAWKGIGLLGHSCLRKILSWQPDYLVIWMRRPSIHGTWFNIATGSPITCQYIFKVDLVDANIDHQHGGFGGVHLFEVIVQELPVPDIHDLCLLQVLHGWQRQQLFHWAIGY